MRARSGWTGDERGIILPLTLIVLVLIATLVSALLAVGTSEPQIAANLVKGAQALSLAEAGAERAIAYFNNDSTCVDAALNTDTYPGYPSGMPSTCGTGSGVTLWTSDTLGAGNTGSYTVRWFPVSYATVMIESTGTETSGVTRIVRVVVTKDWSAHYGVLADQVTVTGNAEVAGSAGAVQGNNSVTLSGSDWIVQTATTAGATCSGCTASHVGDVSDSGTGYPTVPLPTATAATFASRATILMGGTTAPSIPTGTCSYIAVSNGTAWAGSYTGTTVPAHWVLDMRTSVGGSATACGLYPDSTTPELETLGGDYNSGGALPAGLSFQPTVNQYGGWSMAGSGSSAGVWSFSGSSSTPDGAYYSTVGFSISGGYGTSTSPWNATFIAGGVGSPVSDSGTFVMTGNSVVKAYLNDVLVVAGNVSLAGTPTLTGSIFATSTSSPPSGYHGNIDVGGNIQLTGNLVATCAGQSPCPTSGGSAYVTGSSGHGGEAKVDYNVPTRTHMLSPTLQIVSWHAISTLD